jgi:hypothetical protein
VADETPGAWPGDSYPLGASHDRTSPDDVPGDGDITAGDRLMVTSRSIQLLRRA